MKSYICDLNRNHPFTNQTRITVVISAALLFLDFVNIPSRVKELCGPHLFWVMLIALMVFLVLFLIENNFLDLLKIKSINRADSFLSITLFSILIYSIVATILGYLYLYKLIILSASLLIILLAVLIRACRYSAAKKQSEEYNSNLIDLKDLYEGNITATLDGGVVLLEEKDVDYDLLGRDRVINHLYNAILSAKPDGKFVISLEGQWGSGKTTIIRNVIAKIHQSDEDIVVIDEFDPWVYGDENALFSNLFNLIIQKSGLKYSSLFTEKMTNKLSELVLGTDRSSQIKSILFKDSNDYMKSRINNYFKLSGKKFVCFIDNLDRTDSKNVVLLFKLIGNILDLERITYVLSFDDSRVRKILEEEHNLDYEYLKKIINLQIRVPEIDKTILANIFIVSLTRILIMLGEDEYSIKDYDVVIKFISNKFDLRDFKRFINSAINSSFITKHYLNKKDLLVLELIKFLNFSLYSTIYDEREFFISHDSMNDPLFSDQAFRRIFDSEGFNSEGKTFFTNLFKEPGNQEFKRLLGEIFPYVRKFNEGQDLVYSGNLIAIDDPEREMISKKRSVCSGKYFDLYFTETNNAYTAIANSVEHLVSAINTRQPFESKQTLFEKFLKSDDSISHRERLERIQLYLDDFKQEHIVEIIRLFVDKINVIDNSREFMTLNARDRVAIIVHALLNKVSDDEYAYVLDSMTKNYSRIEFLTQVLYWFNKDRRGINIGAREELFEDAINKMAAEVINKKIDLYEDKNYLPQNILGLYRATEDEPDKLIQYMKLILNGENIFRFLYDITGVSIGGTPTRYKYYIKRSNLEEFSTYEEVNQILELVEPETDDEKFVLEVYRASVNNLADDVWGEPGVVVNQQRNLIL